MTEALRERFDGASAGVAVAGVEGTALLDPPGIEEQPVAADSTDARLAADGKAADAFRTIGEVSRALSIRAHVLRYWEEQFPMLRPVKRSGGRRYYRPSDIALIETIDRLVHREGFTLRGARQYLEAQGSSRSGRRASNRAPASNEAILVSGTDATPAAAEDMLVDRLIEIRDGLSRALD